MRMYILRLSVIYMIIINGTNYLYSQDDTESNSMNPLYFENPQEAIPVIKKLLIASDWEMLSRYYDLRNSDITLEKLLTGEFFIRSDKPDVAHPGGFWRYIHPFPPAYKYHHCILTRDNIYEIEMSIEIDQSNGEFQKGFLSFFMIKSEKGFQILPVE